MLSRKLLFHFPNKHWYFHFPYYNYKRLNYKVKVQNKLKIEYQLPKDNLQEKGMLVISS